MPRKTSGNGKRKGKAKGKGKDKAMGKDKGKGGGEERDTTAEKVAEESRSLKDLLESVDGADRVAKEVDTKTLRNWLKSSDGHDLGAHAHRLQVCRVLAAQRGTVKHGKATAWITDQAERLELADRTIRMYVTIGRFLARREKAGKLATALPIRTFQKPFRQLPKAIRNFEATGNPDKAPPKPEKVLDIDDLGRKWIAAVNRLIAEAESVEGEVQGALECLSAILISNGQMLGNRARTDQATTGEDEEEGADLQDILEPGPVGGEAEAASP